jgi:hypothetical protein
MPSKIIFFMPPPFISISTILKNDEKSQKKGTIILLFWHHLGGDKGWKSRKVLCYPCTRQDSGLQPADEKFSGHTSEKQLGMGFPGFLAFFS